MTELLTVAAVRALAEAAGKDYAVVIAVAGTDSQFVTWGREPDHKVRAADLADYLGAHLCGRAAPQVTLADFRSAREAADSRARVEALEAGLRRLRAQALEPAARALVAELLGEGTTAEQAPAPPEMGVDDDRR